MLYSMHYVDLDSDSKTEPLLIVNPSIDLPPNLLMEYDAHLFQ